MTSITITDLSTEVTLNKQQLAETKGGWWYYFNVFNPRINPFGYALQNSWISTSRMWDNHNANFLSYLRS